MWDVATSKGYCIKFNPYLGAGNYKINPELGLGWSVVSKLVAVLPKNYAPYHIITDNFFTSLPLFRHLKQNNVYSTGTIRSNRLESAPLKDIKVMEK